MKKKTTEDWKFKQVGGSHYMYMKIQPAEFINKNKLNRVMKVNKLFAIFAIKKSINIFTINKFTT